MNGKTIVITGASDGIGKAAAAKLSEQGHRVVIVGRNPEKTEKTARELGAPFHVADYERLSDVRRLASELRRYDRIDVLANNAGGLFGERTITEDGFEKTFQINVLASVLLVKLLLDRLLESDATVLQTSSIASNLFGKDFDIADLNTEKDYTPVKAYGNAKLENALLAKELARRFGPEGLHAASFEPGVVRTNFASESSEGFMRFAYHSFLKYLFTISPERSAGRLVRLASGTPGKDFTDGESYSGKKIFKIWCRDRAEELGKELWDRCEKMLE